MTSFNRIQSIEGKIEIRRANALIADVVEGPGDFRAEWLKAHRWVVVPVESADHFMETDIGLLSAALRRSGYSECLAVATEPLTPLSYRVPTAEGGLRELNAAVRNFFFILITEDRSCAMLWTKKRLLSCRWS